MEYFWSFLNSNFLTTMLGFLFAVYAKNWLDSRSSIKVFVRSVIRELENDIQIFNKIIQNYDPNHETKSWIDYRLLYKLSYDFGLSSKKDNIPIVGDDDFENKVFLYCQGKQSFIQEADTILRLISDKTTISDPSYNLSSLTSLVNSLSGLISIAEKIIDRLKKR